MDASALINAALSRAGLTLAQLARCTPSAPAHGVVPLALASDGRATIGRTVDATTAELLRDDVRKYALAETDPL